MLKAYEPDAPAARPVSGDRTGYLTFQVGTTMCAIDVMRVVEIQRWRGATSLPGAPEGVAGVMERHGTMVPLIDLRGPFGAEPTFTSTTLVVVVAHTGVEGDTEVGLVADAVVDVGRLQAGAAQLARGGGLCGASYVRRLARLGSDVVVVLDVDQTIAGLTMATGRSTATEPTTATGEARRAGV